MTKHFMEAMQKANTVLLESPSCIAIDLIKVDGNSMFGWLDKSTVAKKGRTDLRKILNSMWQEGNYNYEQIARGLRVDVQTVQGLMDEEFIHKYSL